MLADDAQRPRSWRNEFRYSARAFAAVGRNRALRRVQLALSGSELGIWGYLVALSVIAFETGGAGAVGVMVVVLTLGPAIASPFLSVLGDEFDRVHVMIAADLLRVALLALAAVLAIMDAGGVSQFVIAAFVYVIGAAFRPAQAALLPSLARSPNELAAANLVTSTIESVAAFAGPAVAGVILALTSPWAVFATVGSTYLWSALLLRGIDRPKRERTVRAASGDPWLASTLVAGAREVVRTPRVRLLVSTVGAQTLVAGTFAVFVPVIALELLEAGDETVGTLYAAFAFGGLAGAAVAAVVLVGRDRLAPAFALGTMLWGAPLALLALDAPFALVVGLLAAVGFANTVVDVCANTLLQRAVPQEVLSRVFGVLEGVVWATIAAGGALAGLLAEAVGARIALVAAGAFLPVFVLVFWRRLLEIDRIAETQSLDYVPGA